MSLFTVEDAADYFRVQPDTVRRWAARGDLRGVKVGRRWRFSQAQINRFYSWHEQATADILAANDAARKQ